MNKLIIFCMTFAYAIVLSAAPFSLDNLQEGILNFNADHFEFDNRNGTITYSGNVIVTLGNRKLRSDELILYRNPEGEITKVIAKGKPAHVQGTAENKPEIIDAYAEIIEYNTENEMLYLRKNAKVKRGKDIYEAPEIQYDVKNEIIRSQPSGQQRTHIIIDADSLKQNE